MNPSSSLPLLPGYSFERKIGGEYHPKPTGLDLINGEIPYAKEIKQPPVSTRPFEYDIVPGRYPSLFPCKEHPEKPAWIIYDKKILSFEAFFYGKSWESNKDVIRKVKINFFLEDGTVQVNEKRVPNSGISQGTLISRQRVPFPMPSSKAFYEMTDFNIGCTVQLFGKNFLIVNCDNFTRNFLNRAGIAIGDPIPYPDADEKPNANFGRRVTLRPKDKFKKFLQFDGKILRFYGYWDDRASDGGQLHKIILYYYLADDTISIRDDYGVLLSRCRLPKNPASLPGPGESELTTYLNVFPTGFLKGRIALDPLNVGVDQKAFYEDKDLAIGACINAYKRAIMLTSCDPFTREYYRVKYGLDTFPELTIPVEKKDSGPTERELPPWNGYGTFEDSEMNCRSFILKAPHVDGVQLHSKSRYGYDSYIFRFLARLVVRDYFDNGRRFIISFYLSDNTTSVFERAEENSGFLKKMFIGRKEAFKPVHNMFVSRKPSTYSKEDFWVGNVLEIESYKFEILHADEYSLRYMEINSQEFPKSNITIIMNKVKDKIQPIYKNFVAKHFSTKSWISREKLEEALVELLGNEITVHEVITIARHFAFGQRQHKYTKDSLKEICRNECRRHLFQGYDRLCENLKYLDRDGCGYLAKSTAYSVCRGARVPIEPELLNTVLERVHTNACGEVEINDLLEFFGGSWMVATTPFNHVREFSEFARLAERPEVIGVDICKFLDYLGLEKTLENE